MLNINNVLVRKRNRPVLRKKHVVCFGRLELNSQSFKTIEYIIVMTGQEVGGSIERLLLRHNQNKDGYID